MTTLPAVLGAIFGFLTVAMGAFGAHALKQRLSAEALGWWETATQYLAIHALALLLCAALAPHLGQLRIPTYAFAAGSVVFSGSLYTMALTGVRGLGAITPIGGLLLLVGWAALVVAALRA